MPQTVETLRLLGFPPLMFLLFLAECNLLVASVLVSFGAASSNDWGAAFCWSSD